MYRKGQEQGGKVSLTFDDILMEMNQNGGFARSVLATSEGLTIASAPDSPDNELASAMVALLQQVGAETQDYLGMTPVDEVTIRTEDHVHLVCRRINSGDDWLTLCVLVPAGKPYRRATNIALRKIRNVIDG